MDVCHSHIGTRGYAKFLFLPVWDSRFGAGNAAYAAAFAGTEVGAPRMLRIVNQPDIVPTVFQ